MAKNMNKDFAQFQKHFKHYQQRFGLTGYKAYFKHEPLQESFANITASQSTMVATVRLNSKLPEEDKPFKDIKRTAKHEAIHLLLERLVSNAKYRYAAATEIDESAEELVYKLEELIEEK